MEKKQLVKVTRSQDDRADPECGIAWQEQRVLSRKLLPKDGAVNSEEKARIVVPTDTNILIPDKTQRCSDERESILSTESGGNLSA